jgi:hypothetical protein
MRIITALLFLLAANLFGQDTTGAWIKDILPDDATIIETSAINTSARPSRALVLWMLHPKKVLRDESCAGGATETTGPAPHAFL